MIFVKIAILNLVLIFLLLFHKSALRFLYKYLSISDPVSSADVLVIEGWIFNNMWELAIKEFIVKKYQYCIITNNKNHLYDNKNNKKSKVIKIKKVFKEYAVQDTNIVIIDVMDRREFTYHSAVAVKNCLQKKKLPVTSINVFTVGYHARKSLLIYKRVLGEKYSVGVLSATITHFDPDNWWLSLRGIKSVIRYAVGTLYAGIYPFEIED